METLARELLGSIALVWTMTFLSAPVHAQVGDTEGTTTFTVQLLVLEIEVTPASIDLGVVSAGGSVFSPPTISASNNSNVAADYQIAGTNAEQPNPDPINLLCFPGPGNPCNPTCFLVNTPLPTASDQFRFGFSVGASPLVYSFLAGPVSPTTAFPTTGAPQTLALGRFTAHVGVD